MKPKFSIDFDHDPSDPDCVAIFKWEGNTINVIHDDKDHSLWWTKIYSVGRRSSIGPFNKYIHALNAAYVILDHSSIQPKDYYEWDILTDFIERYNK